MICANCGREIPDKAKFCPYCSTTTAQGNATQPNPDITPTKSVQKVPNAAPGPKRKSRLAVIIAVAVALVVAAGGTVALVLLGSRSGSSQSRTTQVSVPEEATSSITDATGLADELSSHYRSRNPEPTGADSQDSAGESQDGSGSSTFQQTHDRIENNLTRIGNDLKSLEQSGTTWKGYKQAKEAMLNIQKVLNYDMQVYEAGQKMRSSLQSSKAKDTSGAQMAYDAIDALYQGYKEIDAPDFMEDYLKKTLDKMPVILEGIKYSAQGATSTLPQYTYKELYQWWNAKQTGYDIQQNEIMATQTETSRDMLKDLSDSTLKVGTPSVSIETIDKIAPNLYPSLDSAAIVGIVTYDGEQSVVVSVEVAGFTQRFEQKYDLSQGYNYLAIKPALLPTNQMTNLSSNSQTQIDVKVSDADTDKVIAQESKEIDLLSMYDFTWNDDEFGSTDLFEILAWLRPQADEVNGVNRLAASYMGKWTDGQYESLAGYQFGDDWGATLLQVAAIQAAISEKGVTYVNDFYSFTSNQHVLTADQVVKKQQGLCIETSLLMASCLMSAGMHPMIIITPGHAQVAIETYAGSGEYFLIETTTLPYSGIKADYHYSQPEYWNGLLATTKTAGGTTAIATPNGSTDEWKAYLDAKKDGSTEFGGVFVIDCNLQRVLDIQGLENL